jgi:hypothetical protein
MISQNVLVFSAVGAATIVLFFFVIKLYLLTKNINNSFAKLGFVVREDAKKYFDDAANKIVETNEGFQELYQQAIAKATQEVMVDSGVVMERALSEAQVNAGKVLLQAQSDAQNIVSAAKKQADKEYAVALKRSVDTISWAMEQYLRENYSVQEHEVQIQRIITAYLNENRK